jgi:hypothetical protein
MPEPIVNTMVAAPCRRRHPRLRPTRVGFIQVSLNKSRQISCSTAYKDLEDAMVDKSDSANGTPEAQLRCFIDNFDPKHQKLIRSIRSAVRKRFPTANELAYEYPDSVVIGYSPNDRGIESIVAISARVNEVRLYFNQAVQMSDPKKLLLGSGKQTRFIRLEAASQLAHPDVEALIVAAIDKARVPLPSTGRGRLIIQSSAAKRRPRRRRAK